MENQPSAAQAIAHGIQQAKHDYVIFMHQDVYLPDQWDSMFCQQILHAESTIDNIGMFGVWGIGNRDGQSIASGHLVDRHMLLSGNEILPAQVDSLDDCLICFKKEGFPGMDPAFLYHLYATDLACTYRERGQCAVVLDALCYHNSVRGQTDPPEFFASARYLASKWKQYLPITTPRLIVPKTA